MLIIIYDDNDDDDVKNQRIVGLVQYPEGLVKTLALGLVTSLIFVNHS